MSFATPVFLPLPRLAGVTLARYLLLGANTPWKRVRLTLGLGISETNLEIKSRLAALVPRPRVNLTRFHGVFAPNSKYRSKVTPAGRGKLRKRHPASDVDQTPAEKRASMTWAKRLKRVFNIDIETCNECGGDVRIIASIEDPAVIQKILAHLNHTVSSAVTALLPDCRASPSLPAGLFD